MLWRQLRPDYRKLLRRGAAGKAVVVKSRALSESTGLGAYTHELTLRLRFDDGTETTVTRVAEVSDVTAARPGAVVPVRYDPRDHDKVEIDVATIRETKQRAREQGDRAAIDVAEESVPPNHSLGE